MDPWLVLVVVLVWIGIGVAAATIGLGRRGYRDRHWLVLGVVLGPLFLPVALERGRRDPVEVERRVARHVQPAGRSGATEEAAAPVLLVALDGSPEADGALATATRLVAGGPGRLVLVSVVGREVAEGEDPEGQARARRMLEERATGLDRDAELVIVSGQPVDALLSVARETGADALVIGRHGGGLSSRLLGSVATGLARHSPLPVLLAPPRPDAAAG
ncbi:MAG TPA: universal stress protein [Jiangellales bacterium]|nr:universal stress protein [Jiangellales bacterium]